MMIANRKYVLTILLLTIAIVIPSIGQAQEKVKKSSKFQKQTFNALEERSKMKYRLIPLPSYDPATKFGVSVANMFTYYPDKTDTISPPTTTALYVMGTTNGSWLVGAKQTTFLKHDSWRANLAFGAGGINQIMNLGQLGDADAKKSLLAMNLDIQRKVWQKLFLGLRYNYRNISISGRDDESEQILEQADFTGRTITHGIGLLGTADYRDNIFFPYHGFYVKYYGLNYFPNTKGKGANHLFANIIDYAHFFSLNDENSSILAYHIVGNFLSGDATPENFSMYGHSRGGGLQRGYAAGSYIDKNLVSLDVEWRKRTGLFKNRFGYTIFTGVGKVYGYYNSFNKADWLPTIGAGARYMILPYERLNIRFDTTYSKDGFGFYFGIREAF
ncbi:outer membrane protein assembly factor [Halosquirtibacter laminarini]|uniref:Outer membrane protein assembly factor n=1 Tax=Halosquirtibacter laminarini TaxID=3374600 RepID=A0AC61NJ30_9BACT|nr:outer membrane protein assembly factor [Prolixibacteraceae bacterium]